MKSEHPIMQMVAIAVIAAAVLIGASYAIPWFPTAASGTAREVDTLYHVLLDVSIVIFVLVMTVAIYSVWRFRARPGDMSDGAPIHGHARLEVAWVTVPFLIVAALAGYGVKVLADEEHHQPGELHVRVIGQQFAWHFQYEDGGNFQTEQLYLARGRPVRFKIMSRDVVHAFWAPSMRLQQDAVPGQTTTLRVTPDRVGSYDLICAELCGIGHATMRATIHVLSPQAFQAWFSRQHPGTQVPGTSVYGRAGAGRLLAAANPLPARR